MFVTGVHDGEPGVSASTRQEPGAVNSVAPVAIDYEHHLGDQKHQIGECYHYYLMITRISMEKLHERVRTIKVCATLRGKFTVGSGKILSLSAEAPVIDAMSVQKHATC